MMSKSFLDRIAVKKSINYSECGNGSMFRYQWADYKTSVLCQEMNKERVANFDQQIFIQNDK